MSDDQIATALGKLLAGQDMLREQLRDYIEAHNVRHTEDRERADARHRIIDQELAEHAAEIHRAQGAKGAIIAVAGLISAGVGSAVAFIVKRLS